MGKVEFLLDKVGGADILRNNPTIKRIQDEQIASVLSHVEAQFFLKFGVEGKFKLKQYTTDRYRVVIAPANKQTSAILKNKPGWVQQFVQNIRI